MSSHRYVAVGSAKMNTSHLITLCVLQDQVASHINDIIRLWSIARIPHEFQLTSWDRRAEADGKFSQLDSGSGEKRCLHNEVDLQIDIAQFFIKIHCAGCDIIDCLG